MRKLIMALGLATLALSITFGAATSLAVLPNDLASGSAPVMSCDSDGVIVDYIYDMSDPVILEELIVSDINDLCDGAKLTISLSDPGGSTIWWAETFIPVDAAASVTFPVGIPESMAGLGSQVRIALSGQVGF